jgi:C4-dicarboxylate-specific signal transduction histidine kinase
MTANKTAVSGALSASIAHEINQPLGAVKINSQHLDLLIKNKKEKKLIKSIIEDNDKAAKIISTLKSIFGNNNTTYQIIEFDSFIESYKPFLIQAASEKNILLKFHLDSSVSVKINSDQIQQVISNLFQNSIQALSRIEKRKKVIEIKTFIKNNKLIFLISDNGPGIDPKIKNKIFEIYESSKSENIGLGLWLCKYIISLHKGTIKANKQILQGAEFLIELPISYHE